MDQCRRLFRAEAVHAYFVGPGEVPVGEMPRVVVAADVTINPVADDVHVCPNPIAMPGGPREFVVAGTTRPGIDPMILERRRITYEYPSDAIPEKVVVYTMGVDAPSRQEVPLSEPPPPLEADARGSAAEGGQQSGPPVELVGYSRGLSLHEALHDVIAQAKAKFPSPPRNPDVDIVLDVKDLSARAGNVRPGLFLRVVAQGVPAQKRRASSRNGKKAAGADAGPDAAAAEQRERQRDRAVDGDGDDRRAAGSGSAGAAAGNGNGRDVDEAGRVIHAGRWRLEQDGSAEVIVAYEGRLAARDEVIVHAGARRQGGDAWTDVHDLPLRREGARWVGEIAVAPGPPVVAVELAFRSGDEWDNGGRGPLGYYECARGEHAVDVK